MEILSAVNKNYKKNLHPFVYKQNNDMPNIRNQPNIPTGKTSLGIWM